MSDGDHYITKKNINSVTKVLGKYKLVDVDVKVSSDSLSSFGSFSNFLRPLINSANRSNENIKPSHVNALIIAKWNLLKISEAHIKESNVASPSIHNKRKRSHLIESTNLENEEQTSNYNRRSSRSTKKSRVIENEERADLSTSNSSKGNKNSTKDERYSNESTNNNNDYENSDNHEEYVTPLRSSARLNKKSSTAFSSIENENCEVVPEEEHQSVCENCNLGGHLLLCDTCTLSFHLPCLDPPLDVAPDGIWSCPTCINEKSYSTNAISLKITNSKSIRKKSMETKLNNLNGNYNKNFVEKESHRDRNNNCKVCNFSNNLLTCSLCSSNFHGKCLNPQYSNILIKSSWRCHFCTSDPIYYKIERIVFWKYVDLLPTDNQINDGVLNKPYRIRKFFVKFEGLSYWESTWITETQVLKNAKALYHSYVRKNDLNFSMIPEDEEQDYKDPILENQFSVENCESRFYRFGVKPEWLQIQRVIDYRNIFNRTEYLVKWCDLNYTQCSWESESSDKYFYASTELKKFCSEYHKACREMTNLKKTKSKRSLMKEPYKTQPAYISNSYYDQSLDIDSVDSTENNKPPNSLLLHPYQLDGLNWLRHNWFKSINCILADEMGLGKTIQSIVFLYSLVKENLCSGPFLVAAPLSTIPNWEREFELWAPHLRVLCYNGDKDNRYLIRSHDFLFDPDEGFISGKRHQKNKDSQLKFHVLIVSYELLIIDTSSLQFIEWSILIVDEAHKLKNNQSKFFKRLSNYSFNYKVLLTGTPLQNNLEELFHLLQFIDNKEFSDKLTFLEEFHNIEKEDQIKKLHQLLGSRILRRLKADVLHNIPTKTEIIIRVDLSPLQKKYYKWILTKNFAALVGKSSQHVSLLNIVAELKKCCNHPYLFNLNQEDAPIDPLTNLYNQDKLIEASGKLVVLSKMLVKLKKQGHRILIFSQMTKMLNILEDFLENAGFKYERIDGNISGHYRQVSINQFNATGSDIFCFLLSTRAGGLGINLATADTVFIFDSDWNPHNDIQAFSRAHRIGQCKKVMIYRFVTRKSIEERILHIAKKKMMLTHMIVPPGMGPSRSSSNFSKTELDDLLKFGAKDLFKDMTNDSNNIIIYDDQQVDALLDRSTIDDQSNCCSAINEFLSSFKVAQYAVKDNEDLEEQVEGSKLQKKDSFEASDVYFWEKLLSQHWDSTNLIDSGHLGKGKRIKKQVTYIDPDLKDIEEAADSDYDEANLSGNSSNGESIDRMFCDPGTNNENTFNKKLLNPKKTPTDQKSTSNPSRNQSITIPSEDIHGFVLRQRRIYLNSVLRYGMPSKDFNLVKTKWLTANLRCKNASSFKAYTETFVRHLLDSSIEFDPTFSHNVSKDGISRSLVLSRICTMELVRKKVKKYGPFNKFLWHVLINENILSTSIDSNDLINHLKEIGFTRSNDKKVENDKNHEELNSLNESFTSDDLIKSKTSLLYGVAANANDLDSLNQQVYFNIEDYGFTELQILWEAEERRKHHEIWWRYHDLWLLAGVMIHGYCRMQDIQGDRLFEVINLPFCRMSNEYKSKFISRRFKLLEQALVVEEQCRIAVRMGLSIDIQHPSMTLYSKYLELEVFVECHKFYVEKIDSLLSNNNEHDQLPSKNSMENLQNALQMLQKLFIWMDDLIHDMRNEVSRLGLTLSQLPPVTERLKLPTPKKFLSNMNNTLRMNDHISIVDTNCLTDISDNSSTLHSTVNQLQIFSNVNNLPESSHVNSL